LALPALGAAALMFALTLSLKRRMIAPLVEVTEAAG
jgi:hypothetical protein